MVKEATINLYIRKRKYEDKKKSLRLQTKEPKKLQGNKVKKMLKMSLKVKNMQKYLKKYSMSKMHSKMCKVSKMSLKRYKMSKLHLRKF